MINFGEKFNNLTVIGICDDPKIHKLNNKGKTVYKCECDCVDKSIIYTYENSLRTGKMKDCGCHRTRPIIEDAIRTKKKFGRLVIVEQIPSKIKPRYGYKIRMVKCKCDCGNFTNVELSNLLYGTVLSCGCYKSEQTRKANTTHGYIHHRLYYVHSDMISRCYNPKDINYKNYGGRVDSHPITVCDEWHTPGVKGNPGLVNFIKWAYKNGYYDQPKNTPKSELLTIERNDVNGNYEPNNCSWIPFKDQAKNKRNNRFIFDGEENLHYAGFEKKYGLTEDWVQIRLRRGWSKDAIVYAAKHKEDNIHKTSFSNGKNSFVDNEGFKRLIPTLNNKLYHELEEKYRDKNSED